MSLIGLTADWHAGGKDLEDFQRQLAAMVDECNARGVDMLAVAGDIFDNSAIQDRYASTGAIARAIHIELSGLDCDVLMIPGNHDSAGCGSADALNIFPLSEHIAVEREARWLICPATKLSIYCVPWDWSGAPFPDPFADPVKGLGESFRTLLLAHAEVGGAMMNGGAVCQADSGKFQVTRAALEALPFDKIAFGHFHKRQDYFIGALRQDDFGHEGDPAGFEIWDTETDVSEWIELDAAPRHKTWIMAPGDAPPPECPPGWRYKVKLTGEQPDYVLVRDLERDGCVVELNLDMVQRLTRASVPPNVINDPRALMALWTESNDIGDERLARMLEVWDGLAGDENKTEGEARNESA